MRRKYRRRRTYISPIQILVVLALLAGLVWLLWRGLGTEAPPEEPPAGGESQEPFAGQQPAELPEHTVSPSGTACTLTELGEEALYTGELILVNNWTAYHFPQEQELVCMLEESSGDYYVRDYSVYLSPVAMEALERMMADFRAQGGSRTVNVVAGYRTAEEQQHLFDQSAERNGLDHAEKYVAKPGGSEHHTGLVVDFSLLFENGTSGEYEGTGEYAWINENCPQYGWVVRYDQAKAELTGIYDEPWHFRYVGIPHALKMAELGLCLEEYEEELKQYTFQKPLTIDCDAGTYEVWYTRGTKAYLPDSGEYQVSGNNMDGIIVTCRVK